MLDVSPTIWFVTIGALVLVLGIDLLIAARKGPHTIGVGEARRWVLFDVALAIAFGIGLAVFAVFRQFNGWWRHAGLYDLTELVKAATVSAALFWAATTVAAAA